MKRNNPSPSSGYAKRPFGACVVDRNGRRLPQPPALVGNTGSSSRYNETPGSSGRHQVQLNSTRSYPPPSAIGQNYQPGPSQHPSLVGSTGSSSRYNETPGSSGQHQVQLNSTRSYPPPSAIGQNYQPGPSQHPVLVGYTGSSSLHDATPSSSQHQVQGSNPWSYPPTSAIGQNYQPGPSQHPALVGYTGFSSLHDATPSSGQHQVQGSNPRSNQWSNPWSNPPPSAVGQNCPPGSSQHPSLVGYTGSSSWYNAIPGSSQHQVQGSNPWSNPPPSTIDQTYHPGPSHREDTRQITPKKSDILVDFTPITLISNCLECIHDCPQRTIYEYRVDFKPADVDRRDKITFLQPYQQRLPTNVFDGNALLVTKPLNKAELKMLNAKKGINHDYITKISTRQVAQTGKVLDQISSCIVIMNCLIDTGLQEIDGVLCDNDKKKTFDHDRLDIWQGHKISMGKREDKNILTAEFDHKMILHYNCLQIIKKYGGEKSRLMKDILGKIVKTIHDRKTYRVDGIDWNSTPQSALLHNGKPITFVEYFKIKNGLDIKDYEQPLFISLRTMKDLNSGNVEPIKIIPELCQLTDYTEEMISQFKLTSAVTTHMQKEPTKHVEELIEFSNRLQTPNVVEELQKWGLNFPKGPEKIQGSEISKQTIKFGNDKDLTLDDKCNWYQAWERKNKLLV
ncbi:unnamed protein product [Orchesella dallaii]|uniref:PAZ domain-containing protein n=1 Tax=Orchesella dallaii TaxID=48710 RepID=A0ABP1PU71_9HEXA